MRGEGANRSNIVPVQVRACLVQVALVRGRDDLDHPLDSIDRAGAVVDVHIGLIQLIELSTALLHELRQVAIVVHFSLLLNDDRPVVFQHAQIHGVLDFYAHIVHILQSAVGGPFAEKKEGYQRAHRGM